MTRSNVTHAEALRRLVAEVKLLDAVEVGERWNQLGGVLAVAEGVLRDGEKQEPVAYLRFRAAQMRVGACDIDHNEWLETCHAHEIGDDKLPAFPVYATPFIAPTAVVAVPEGFALVPKQPTPEMVNTLAEGNYSISITDAYVEMLKIAPQPAAAPSGDAWQPIETAPKDGMRFLGVHDGKVGFWHWQGDDPLSTRPVGWRDNFIHVYREGSGPTHWMPIPDVAAITATKE